MIKQKTKTMSIISDEAIEKASYDYFNSMKDEIETDVCVAFSEGAKWADKHAVGQWISVNEALPKETDDIIVTYTFESDGEKIRSYAYWQGYILLGEVTKPDNTCDYWMKIPEIAN